MKTKIILWISVFLLIVSTASAALDDTLIHAYNFQQNCNDTVGSSDCTVNGNDYVQTGPDGNYIVRYDNQGTPEWVDFNDLRAANLLTDATVCALVNSTDSGTGIFNKGPSSANPGYEVYTSGGSIILYVDGVSSGSGGTFTAGSWELICASKNSTHVTVWDDASIAVTSTNLPSTTADDFRLGINPPVSGAWSFLGGARFLYIWNRSLTSSEMTELYNSGSYSYCSGDPCKFAAAPVITVNVPINTTRYNDVTNPSEFNITTDVNANCSVAVISSNYTQVNITQTGGLTHLFAPTGTIQNGIHRFNATCSNAGENSSAIFEFQYDDIRPPITWQSPAYENVTSSTAVTFFEVNASDENLFQMYINVTYPNGTLLVENSILDINTTSYTLNTSVTFGPYGEYTFCAEASDDHTSYIIPDYRASILGTTVRLETEHGTDIRIYPENPTDFTTSEIDIQKKGDRYSYTFGNPTPVRRTKNFILKSSHELTYLKDTSYDGHFVSNKNWIDFVTSDSGQTVIVTKIDDYTYRVRVTSLSFDFNSVGGLNINTECITYNYIDEDNRSTLSTEEYDQPSPVTITSSTYTDILTGTFNNSVASNLSLYAVGNIRGGGGSVVATCSLFKNNNALTNVTLSPANNEVFNFHMHTGIVNFSVGVINVSIACKKDSTSNFEVFNSEAVVFQFLDEDLENLDEQNSLLTANVTTSTYADIGNISILASAGNAEGTYQNHIVLEGTIDYTFDSTGTICLRYTYNGEVHNDSCRYGTAGSSGSGSLHGIIQNVTESTSYDIEFEAFSTTSDGQIDIDIDSFEITVNENEIGHRARQSIQLTSATAVPLFNESITINQTGDTLIAYGTFSVESLAGSSDVALFWSIDNGAQINGSSVERSLTNPNQFGVMSAHTQFVNLTEGAYTVTLYGSASNTNVNMSLADYSLYPSRTIFSTTIEYTVSAYHLYNGSLIENFNATVASTGAIYTTTTGTITIPRGVLSENITVNASGYEGNLTINHNTLTNLNVTLQPLPLDPGLVLNISPSTSIVVDTQSNVSGNSCPAPLTCNLYRDGVLVSNPDVQNLSIGTYTYIFNTSGDVNYTSDSVTGILTVTADPGPPVCTPQTDDAVYFNESYTWYTTCTNPNANILWFNITCDNGFSNNIFVNATSYQYSNTTGLLTTQISCNITTNTEYGTLTYDQIIRNVWQGFMKGGQCNTSDAGISLLWLMLAVSLVLYLMSYVARAPIFMILSSFGFFVSSFYIAACAATFTYVLIALAVLILIQSFMGKRI